MHRQSEVKRVVSLIRVIEHNGVCNVSPISVIRVIEDIRDIRVINGLFCSRSIGKVLPSRVIRVVRVIRVIEQSCVGHVYSNRLIRVIRFLEDNRVTNRLFC